MLKLNLREHRIKTDDKGVIHIRNEYKIGRYEIVQFIHGKLDGSKPDKDYAVRPELGTEYAPDIYLEHNWFDDEKPEEFLIQTAARGAKTLDEIEKVIAGYQEAVEVVKVLTKEFLK